MKKQTTRILTFVLMAVFAFLVKMPAQASDAATFAPVFNAAFYAEANADLKVSFGTNETLLFQHFLTSGMKEGRQGSAEFNVQVYQALNPDLVAVFGNDLTSYYLHYINSGKAEGRIASTTAPAVPNTPVANQTTTTTQVIGPYNPSNSLAISPLAPKAAESVKSYKKHWTWTASNGYSLKLKFNPNQVLGYRKAYDAATKKIIEVPYTPMSWAADNYRIPSNIIYDQPFSYRPDPNSPYLWAYLDFNSSFNGDKSSRPENFFISTQSLPLVNLATTKLTNGISNSSWEAFCKGFNALWFQQTKGKPYSDRYMSDSLTLGSNGTKISPAGVKDVTTPNTIDFELKRQGDSWCLGIKYNEINIPTELLWCGIRNSMRLVTPDAEAIYQQIYEHFYGGNHVFPNYDTWAKVGNSYVKADTPVQPLNSYNSWESRWVYYSFK